MSLRRIPLLLLALSAFGQDVGSGPISEGVRREFLRSFFQNNFSNLVALPPLGDVRRYGTTGLVQEFADAARTQNVKYALIKANATDAGLETDTVFQVYPGLYDYLGTVGVSTAGYPTTHTALCASNSAGSCQFQLFDKNHALFVFSPAISGGSTFFTRDPFFTKWRSQGAIGTLGPAVGAEENLTSGAATGATATAQRFATGAIYNMTAGASTGRVLSVRAPVYELFNANGGATGFLGFPTGEELVQPNDRRRQNFEGGAIEWALGQTPELRLPVSSVSVNVNVQTDRLDLGQSITLSATTFAGNGASLTGRSISWVSSNSRVLSVEPSGSRVTARALGGGAAVITAVSEGKTSRGLTFFVVAPCCQIGEGAPTSAIQQMFIDAATRNRLAVRVPSPSPVRRLGNGYVQELLPQDESSPIRYLLAKPDSLASAFLVTGAVLTRYLALGGPSGALGFPVADPTARGRQLFEGGALAGDPAQSVSGAILTRWAAQTYELGPAGLPTGPAQTALSFQATLAAVQPFAGGLLIAHQSGASINRAFLVGGLILAKYNSLGGAGGSLGLPVDDEYGFQGKRRQDFEGGLIEYAPGATAADSQERDRTPRISATPSAVAAGSRIRIAAGGFPAGATLRISVGGQPDFIVPTETGAYAWEASVPANAPSEIVTLRAADVNGRGLAVGSYVVQSSAETLARVTKIRGDLQTGLPGARLPQPIRISVKDENGNPLIALPVRFNPSPGTQIEDAMALTDEKGEAQAFLRLPLAELPALATAEAGRQVVTFSARTQASTLTNFPRFSQGSAGDTKLGNESSTIAQKGALLVSAAAIVRHLQNEGSLPSPNGPADPLLLNRYLKDLCLFDAKGERVCDGFTAPAEAPERNVNPWRLAVFAGGSLDIVSLPTAGLEPIRDSLARGVPVLLALSLSSGQTALGSHFVAAIGVDGGGGIVIHDPNPAFNRSALNDYLNGFSAAGKAYKATLAATLELAPRTSSALGFLVMTAGSQAVVASSQGPCGYGVAWPDTAAATDAPARVPGVTAFRYCDGAQPSYQLDLAGSGQQRFVLTDLGNVAGRTEASPSLPAAFRLARPASNWTAEPQTLAFTAANVLNAASFTPGLAPGTLASVFGSGLAISGRDTVIEIDGIAAPVVAATAFQVNFQIPGELAPGQHTLRIQSPFGSLERPIELLETAPALFAFPGGRAVAVNQNGSLNAATNPARRGEVIVLYATGLGAVDRRGNFDVVRTPVRVLIEGRELEVQFAGLAPGYPGLYQVNARIPAEVAPGLDLRVSVDQSGRASNRLTVSVQ